MELRKIANVRTGVFAKTAMEGECIYLQSKHFDEEGQIAQTLYPEVPITDIPDRHILQEGDVLLIAKGAKNNAWVYQELSDPAVASTSFFVIQIKKEIISPQYLAWFLNHAHTQNLLKEMAKGSSILSIRKTDFEKLSIQIPSIQKQNLIIQIDKLRQRQKQIYQELQSLNDLLIEQKISQTIFW